MKKRRKRNLPLFIYCSSCLSCQRRNFKNIFSWKSMLDCPYVDYNGLSIRTIIPLILWEVEWCKTYKKK